MPTQRRPESRDQLALYSACELVSKKGSLHCDLRAPDPRQRRREQNAVETSRGCPCRLLTVVAAAGPRYESSHRPFSPGKQPSHASRPTIRQGSAVASATSHSSMRPEAAQHGCCSAAMSHEAQIWGPRPCCTGAMPRPGEGAHVATAASLALVVAKVAGAAAGMWSYRKRVPPSRLTVDARRGGGGEGGGGEGDKSGGGGGGVGGVGEGSGGGDASGGEGGGASLRRCCCSTCWRCCLVAACCSLRSCTCLTSCSTNS